MIPINDVERINKGDALYPNQWMLPFVRLKGNLSNIPHLVLPILVSYIVVYGVSVKFSLKRYKEIGDYGYTDLVPILYFTCVFILMLLL